MFKVTLFYSSFCCFISTVVAEVMIGPGKWNLINIERKPGDFDKFEFDICQRKFNRSHGVFQGSMTFHEDLNDFFGARVDVCKHVDGGCKQFQVITDNCFGDLVEKYAADNFKDMLELAGMKDPKFPVKKDTYKFEKYLWNWDAMPEEGPWGRYTADCCVTEGTLDVGCLIVDLAFEKTDDDDDDDDEE